ncbi:MAG: hypothetical protein E6F95_05485 [Actinobacteria bacterium]|nr:MAG: hypothetical protein E6F95_05485 [Actinomycetota bacterium]
MKCESSRAWGRADDLLERIHAAPDATGDQYPYQAWNSSLASLLPPWVDADALPSDAGSVERLRRSVELGEAGFQSSIDGVGWDRIVVVDPIDDRWRGKDLSAIAAALGFAPFDTFLRLLREGPDTSCIGHAMDPGDVRTILSDPEIMVASDASAIDPHGPGGGLPVHPREYGTFPRALALARDEHLMPLSPLIRSMTSLPAERWIRDAATFDEPHRFSDGLRLVVVNGTIAWAAGSDAITRAGRALRRRDPA